ncbi:RNase H domain-containing protein [Raphanus sativus]|nr:RNase H domain-containing protein [Raphanus sativus]
MLIRDPRILRRCLLGYPESLSAKLMPHGSKMAGSLSALHAEMEGLLWAATCLRDMRMRSVRFETDCRDLVEMMANPSDWPAFATDIEEFQKLQGDFEDVSISHIPRSRNERADALAKSARSRGYLFSHIDQTQTDGDTPRRIGSSALQLI